MAIVNTIRTVVGIIGNVIACGLFLSPVPTFYGIVKGASTGSFSGVPYAATLFNCLLWILYGLPFVTSHSLLVITINSIGSAIEIVYLIVFLAYASSKIDRTVRVLQMIGAVVALYAAIVLCVFTVSSDHHTRRIIAGTFCVIFTVGMYAAPLSIVGQVIATKSVKYMPLLPLVAALLNGATWTTYGFLGDIDVFIVVPNLLGAGLALVQLVLYGIYSRIEKMPIANDTKPRIGDPSEGGAAAGIV